MKHFDNKSPYKFQSDKNRKRRDRRRAIIDGFPILVPFESRREVEEYFESDKITCLQCGKKFHMLKSHLTVHGMTVEDYQRFYELPLSVGLVGAIHRGKLSQRAISLIESGKLKKRPPEEYAGFGGRGEYKRPLYRKNEQVEHAKTMRQHVGEKSNSAVLTERKVKEIKADTKHTMDELASIYGTTRNNIQHILAGRTWKHIGVISVRPRYVRRQK